MSQVGKLYKFYFGKIGQKNWLRIIIFAILIGIVWGFVIPWGITKAGKGAIIAENKNATDEQKQEFKKLHSFSDMCRRSFGGDGYDQEKKANREEIEKMVKKMEAGEEITGNERMRVLGTDNASFVGINTPFTSDNAFFFSQTESYNNMKEKKFGKMLFDISWGNLCGFAVLYWFIFEVLDKTFFLPQEDGEEVMVLTMTPGAKRSDLIGGKILAFLTFYFLINIVLFLIPFGIYYWGLASTTKLSWFALLSLITIVVGPILFFGLIFVPYLFFGSLLGKGKGIFATSISFFPLLGGGLKIFLSSTGPYTVENVFFDPIWFTVISVVSGIFFLTLYYLRYQEEDLG